MGSNVRPSRQVVSLMNSSLPRLKVSVWENNRDRQSWPYSEPARPHGVWGPGGRGGRVYRSGVGPGEGVWGYR